MTRQSEDICAQCEKLTTKGYPEQMAAGKGRCTAYDDDIRPLTDPFVAWNTRACIRFNQVYGSARELRLRWIERRQNKEQNNNEVQTETKG